MGLVGEAKFHKKSFEFDKAVPMVHDGKYLLMVTTTTNNVRWYMSSTNMITGDTDPCDSPFFPSQCPAGGSGDCQSCPGTDGEIPLCFENSKLTCDDMGTTSDDQDFYFALTYVVDYCNINNYSCMGTPE
jgi:hypothetical protein